MKKSWIAMIASLSVLLAGCDWWEKDTKTEPQPQAPGAPQNVLVAHDGADGLRVTWNQVSGADSYNVYRKEEGSASAGRETEDAGIKGLSYTDTKGVPGKKYQYAVSAANAHGSSDISSWTSAQTFPGVVDDGIPTVKIEASSKAEIKISWSPVGGTSVTYNVYRSTSETGTFASIKNSLSALEYTDTELTADTPYWYKVSATVNGVEKEKSSPISAKTDPSIDPAIDIIDYSTNYAARFTNRSNELLISFKGYLSESTILGGIPAGASAHGIKNDPQVFTKNEGFPVIFLSQTQYERYKDNLLSNDLIPYTRIYVTYNKNGTNEKIYEINPHQTSNYTIQLLKGSYMNMNVELRKDGINGPPIGLAPEGMASATFYVDNGDYQLYPVFIKYNQLRGELTTVYPKFTEGRLAGEALTGMWSPQIGHEQETIRLNDLLTTQYKFSTGTAYLIIDNQLTTGSVYLMKGDEIQKTAEGIAGIPSANQRTFPIFMVKTGNNYASEQSIASFKVGQLNGTTYDIGDYTLEVDKVYRVTLTGSGISTLQLTSPIAEGEVDLSDF